MATAIGVDRARAASGDTLPVLVMAIKVPKIPGPIGFGLGVLGALSMETLLHLVDFIPPVLLNGLTVAGKMLPAIGFAMILSVMAKKELIPFVLLGYVCAAYLGVPTIGIAIIGTMFALMEFYNKPKKAEETVTAVAEGDENDDWI